MANGTDTRIVQMQFDNRQFERNIKTSGKSLEQFKKLLNFDKCEKSLEKFGRATEHLTFDRMSDNLQKLTDKFTGLGTMSERVISQIRHSLDSAAASVKRFIDSMTFDQITAGFDKFGQLNKQVQTIMAATGRAEEDVYKVMQRLNQYTDQTSYSFIDMAANIGKFTSVGIGLEEAEKQMEGIANWAARSGGGIQEASRAMYNLSQAMGVGALTKIDWKSIENAGMATKEFKEQLIQAGLATGQLVKQNGKVMTAKALGKQVEVTYQNLAETLSKKWADTEVMQKSFMAYYYEDLYYTGKIEQGVEMSRDQRDEARKLLKQSTERDSKDMANFNDEANKETKKAVNAVLNQKKAVEGVNSEYQGIVKNAKDAKKSMKEGYIDSVAWAKLGIDSAEARQKVLDAAVEQKKLIRETNEEGYTVYKSIGKGKQREINQENFKQQFLDAGLLDESLATVVFGLDIEPMIETTKQQQQALNNALSDDVILKKDWVEDLTKAGLATDEFKQAVLEAAAAEKTLKKETDKATGKTVYKTLKGTIVDLNNFDAALKDKFFTGAVAARVAGTNNLAKAAYEAAQKCLTFTDVLNAWKDQLSTGWMQSYNHIFGELSESMELFSNICNKVGAALGDLISLRNRILQTWGAAGGRDSLWSLIVGEVTDEGEVIAYEGAYGFLDVLGDIGKMISDGFMETLKLIDPHGNWDEEGYLEGFISGTLRYVIDEVRNFVSAIHDFFTATAEGSNKSRWQQIQDVVNAMFATFVLAYSVVRDITTMLGILLDQEHFGPVIDRFLELFSELGLTISDSAKDANEGHGLIYLFRQLDETCRPLITSLKDLATSILDLAIQFLKAGRENGDFKAFWDSVVSGINKVAEVITKYGTPIVDFFVRFVGIIGRLLQNGIGAESLETAGAELKASLKTMLDTLFSGIPNFSERAKAFWDTISNWFSNGFQGADWEALKGKLKSALKLMLSVLPDEWQKGITDTYQQIKTSLKTFKDKIKAFYASVKSAFQNNFNDASLKSLTEKAKDLWGSVIGAIPDGIRTTAKSAYDKIVAYVKDLWTRITGFLNSLFGGKNNPVDGVIEQIMPGDEAKKALDKVKSENIFEKAWNWLRTTLSNLKTSFQKMLGNDAGDAGSFGESLKKLDWGKIMVVILGTLGGVGIITVIAKVIGIVKALAKGFETIAEFMKNGIKFNTEPKKVESFGDKMLKIAIAMALMAASMTVIANLKAEDAWRALGIMTLLGGVLLAMAAVTKLIYKDVPVADATASAIGMVAIGIAIGRVIAAILPLANVNMDQLRIMIWGLTAVIAAMAILGYTAKGGNLSFKNTAGVLAFCGGVWLLVNALLKIKDLKPEQLGRMAGGLIFVLGMLLAFAVGLQKFGGSMAGTGMKEAAFLAAAVGILIFSLLPLAILPWRSLAKMGAGLAVVLFMLYEFVKGVNGLSLEGTQMAQLLAVAGSIVLLVLAMIPLAIMPFDRLAQALFGVGMLIGMLYLFIKNTSGMTTGASGMAQLLAVAGAIVLIVIAMLPLAIMNWGMWGKAVLGIGIIMALLWGFVIGVNKLAKGGLSGTGMLQLLAVAGSIALVVVALTPLALMEPDQIIKMVASLVVILGMFIGVVAATKKLSGESALSAMGMMVMLAALMFAFAYALTVIPQNMDWSVIAAFSVGLGVMLVAVAGALAILEKSKITKDPKAAIIAIAALAVAVAAIMGVVSLLAPMMLGSIGGALENMAAQLSLMGGMFGDFIGEMNSVSEGDIDAAKRKFDKLYNLITSLKDVSKYLPAVRNFSNCCLLLGSGLKQFIFSTSTIGDPEENNGIKLMEKLLGYNDRLSNFKAGREAATQMAYVGAGLNVFNTAVGNIQSADTVAFQMLDKILGYSDKLSGLTGAAAAATQMALLGAGLNIFNTSVGNVTSAETPAFQMLDKILGYAGQLSGLTGVYEAATQIALLGAGLNIFNMESGGITDDNPKALQLLTNMSNNAANLDLLSKIDLTHFSDQMAGLGGALAIYALGIKESAGIKIGDIPDVTGAIAILNSLTQGLSNEEGTLAIPEIQGDKESLTHFGVQLAALAGGLVEFAKASAGLGEGTDKALEVLAFMRDLKTDLTTENLKVTKTFSEAGIYSATALADFGVQISALGSSLATYSEDTKNFVKNQGALDVLDFMADLKDKLNKDKLDVVHSFGGAGIYSDTALAEFGTQISALGSSLSTYNSSVQYFRKNQDALDVLDFMADLKGRLDKSNLEVITKFKDAGIYSTSTITDFGNQISALGSSMASYNASVKNFKENENATKAIEFFYKLQEKLLSQSIDAATFTAFSDSGVTPETLSSFGTDIGALGDALAGFAENVNFSKVEGKKTDFDQALKAIGFLERMAAQLNMLKTGGMVQWFEGEGQTISTLAGNVKIMGEAMSQFSDSLSAVGTKSGKAYDMTMVQAAFGSIQSLADMAVMLAKNDTMDIYNGYHYIEVLTDLLDGLEGGENEDFATHGAIIDNMVSFMKHFQDAADEVGIANDSTIFESFKNVANGIQAMAATSPAFDFKPIGLNIDAGIKAGIDEGASTVIDAAVEMAVNAYNAVCGSLGINSPSRLFRWVGQSVPEGMALGITNNIGMVTDAEGHMTDSLIESAKSTMASISTLLANDVDAQPTIRPVLDLSNVTAGARTLNGMFGRSYGLGLDTSGIGSRASRAFTSRSVDTIDQNGSGSESMMGRMDAMLTNIQKMGDGIANMKLVLDTGVLAGGVSDDVDIDIGRKMFYAERRN